MSIADKMLAAVGCGATVGHGDRCTKGWECRACAKLRDFAAEVRYIEQEMQRVRAFLKPNESNDMEWSDEIIIAIQNYEHPLPEKPRMPTDEELTALFRHECNHPYIAFNEFPHMQDVEVLIDGKGTMAQWRALLDMVTRRHG